MNYFGDITVGELIQIPFNTRDTDGAPITLAGTPAVRVYKDDGTTEDDSGITLNVDFDGRTGLHVVEIDTSADGTFYASGADFHVVLTVGTVDSISVVGVCVGAFSIENRSSKAANARTLKAVPDALPNTASGLTTGDVLGWLVTNVGLLGAALSAIPKTGFKLASDGLAAVVAWTVAITGNITGNLSGSVGSVTGNVGGIAGTLNTLDQLDTAQDAQHSTTQSAVADVPTNAELTAALAAADDATLLQVAAVLKLLRADRKIDKTTNAAHWDEVLLEEGTATELVRRELFDADGTALAAETTRIGRAIKSP